MVVKNLGQITDEIVTNWQYRYELKDGNYYCSKCGSAIMQTRCFVSIHLKAFGSTCAGPGHVEHINFPFCPVCDGDIDHVTACYHV